jgi:hypothetical protein
VNYDYFHDQLQPYGVWESTPDYGWVWYPGEAAVNPDWRPYNDGGHWAYSDQGWMWQSDYPWGDVVFHYGRWTRMVDGRWAWVPAYDWAPAWVAWRHVEGDAALGWAPLPPGAEFRAGVGLWWHGGVALDVDFGLGADYFTFVPFDHFWDHDFHRYVFDRDRDRFFYGRSVMRNGYGFDHGRFRMEGLGRDRMAALTHHDVRAFRAGDLRREEEHRDIGRREEAHPEIRRANLDREKREGYTRQPERAAARPGEARPGEARPGEARPGEARPGEARPGEARPGETRPGETRPGESRPGETAGKPGYGTAAKPPAKTTSQPGKSGGESNSKEKKPD